MREWRSDSGYEPSSGWERERGGDGLVVEVDACVVLGVVVLTDGVTGMMGEREDLGRLVDARRGVTAGIGRGLRYRRPAEGEGVRDA